MLMSHQYSSSIGGFMQGLPGSGTAAICETRGFQVQSFPQKRKSTPPAIGNAPPTDWIPACAGMTSVSKGIPFQMTPAPGSLPAVNPTGNPLATPVTLSLSRCLDLRTGSLLIKMDLYNPQSSTNFQFGRGNEDDYHFNGRVCRLGLRDSVWSPEGANL